MSEKRCCDCEHFGLSKGPIFSLITGICGRCGKEVGYTDKCLFEEKNKGESFLEDIYQIMKEDGIIDVMGGSIQVESEKGVGTTFVIKVKEVI